MDTQGHITKPCLAGRIHVDTHSVHGASIMPLTQSLSEHTLSNFYILGWTPRNAMLPSDIDSPMLSSQLNM